MKGGDPYSYPPRGLSREAAARYIGVGASKFDQLVADRRMPKPIRIDGRVIWDRIKIDMAFGDFDQAEAWDGNEWDVTLDADHADRAQHNARSENGPSGYPIPNSADHPLQQHYERLGFDPKTMGRADMDRLRAKAHERWQAEFVHTPLGKRELDALTQFRGMRAGEEVDRNAIKGLGIDTSQWLQARGFIEPRYSVKFPDRIDRWMLTDAGAEAVQAILASALASHADTTKAGQHETETGALEQAKAMLPELVRALARQAARKDHEQALRERRAVRVSQEIRKDNNA